MKRHEDFMECLHGCRLMEVSFLSKKDGDAVVTRTCAPWDYGPNARAKDSSTDYYWFMNLEGDSGVHLMPITPERLVHVTPLDEGFDPQSLASQHLGQIAFHTPRNW